MEPQIFSQSQLISSAAVSSDHSPGSRCGPGYRSKFQKISLACQFAIDFQTLGGGMNGGTVLAQTMWIQDCPLIYTYAVLRGAAQVYVKAETRHVHVCFKSHADLDCEARSVLLSHMLYVQPVANFIPEARLQNMLLVQSAFVLLPNKEQACCLFFKSKIYCKKQHNMELGLHGLNIKQQKQKERFLQQC